MSVHPSLVTPIAHTAAPPSPRDSVSSTPKRRCFAHVWATGASATNVEEKTKRPSVTAVNVNAVHSSPLSERSPLDIEFDQQFELPRSYDTVARWRCPTNWWLFQKRCIQFQDHRNPPLTQHHRSSAASSSQSIDVVCETSSANLSQSCNGIVSEAPSLYASQWALCGNPREPVDRASLTLEFLREVP